MQRTMERLSLRKTILAHLIDPPWVRSSATCARFGVVSAALGLLILHLLPHPMLRASTGALIPYDARLNFMSEYVRTQYGALMTFNFLSLAFAANAGVFALKRHALHREAVILTVAMLGLGMLAIFPSDLAVLGSDGNQCALPGRIEPCTVSGLIHNLMPPFVFGSIGLLWLSLRIRNRPEHASLIRSGWYAFALSVALLVGSEFWLAHIPETTRHWAGLTQRSVAIAGVGWIYLLFGELRDHGAEGKA